MKYVISNNPLVAEKKQLEGNLIYLEKKDYLDVLVTVRDYIHKNYTLLTHPLASNFLPDKTMYKTIIIEESSQLHSEGVSLIEDAIILGSDAMKRRNKKIFRDDVMKDLAFIDYQIMRYPLSILNLKR